MRGAGHAPKEFLALFGRCEYFTYRAYRLKCQNYNAQLWGPDIKGALDDILGADWHVYEAAERNAERKMAYIMCYTPDGRYLDFSLRCLLRSFYSRPPTGEPVKYTAGTLTVSFIAAHSRRLV